MNFSLSRKRRPISWMTLFLLLRKTKRDMELRLWYGPAEGNDLMCAMFVQWRPLGRPCVGNWIQYEYNSLISSVYLIKYRLRALNGCVSWVMCHAKHAVRLCDRRTPHVAQQYQQQLQLQCASAKKNHKIKPDFISIRFWRRSVFWNNSMASVSN